ncbi:MAG: 3,4-dihydroxy-2-butanone-4-phosphate synthase [Rickettsiales bacterium]
MKNNILKAIEDLKDGKMIIVTDDVNRENEGDIIVLAEKVTEETISFIIKKASGLICLAIDSELAKKLDLKLMVENNQESMRTAFTVSIDSRHGITTGISAFDRAKTILDAVSVNAKATDLVRPGHIFPLIAKDGGLFERRGHTEASVELAKLSGFKAAAVICEIIGDDGKMLRGKELKEFAALYKLTLVSIDSIVDFLKG